MNKELFLEDDLNLEEMEAIGLAKNGRLILEDAEREALLSGRRTQMMRLENLTAEGIHIAALDAKVSLKVDESGKLGLLVHPIYRSPQRAPYLTDTEAELLESGEEPNIIKELSTTGGKLSHVLIEFDKETNEYVVTDSEKIVAPDFVNGEELSLDKKERYRKGKEVELDDGTKFQYAGTEPEGLRANKVALIASIVFDGGISFLLYQGLNALFKQQHDEKSEQFSEGYRQAFSDLKRHEGDPEEWLKQHLESPEHQQSRGYGRSGNAR